MLPVTDKLYWSLRAIKLTGSFHWLPRYKIGLLGFKDKHSLLPPYLLELLSDYQSTGGTTSVIICLSVFKTSSHFIFFIARLFDSCLLGVDILLNLIFGALCSLTRLLQIPLKDRTVLCHL